MPAEATCLSVTIERSPDDVYAYASNPENLPKWAPGLCTSVRKLFRDWFLDTPAGEMKLRFVERNSFRVMDHYVTDSAGVEVYIPARVIPNGSGSEIVFTVFREKGMTISDYEKDLHQVQSDLKALKRILESSD
jgi:hypothetical protein